MHQNGGVVVGGGGVRQVNYAPSSSSEHYTASLPRNGRIDPPASPKSMSSRSHYSNEAKLWFNSWFSFIYSKLSVHFR